MKKIGLISLVCAPLLGLVALYVIGSHSLGANILYGLRSGRGIQVTSDGNPNIPLLTNTGVITLQGNSGDVSLIGSSGIGIQGLQLVNLDKGSSQKIFKTIQVGNTTLSAATNTDTLLLASGTGISLSTDTTTAKTVTITNASPTQWVNTSNNIYFSTGIVGIGTTPSYALDVSSGSGVMARFSGRVIGGDAVNTNEFATLGQITSGAGQFWQRNSGALSPTNITDDLLISGSSTSSALFQVFGAGANAGTASTSGNLVFNGSATKISQLNGAGLTFQVSPGGDAGLTTAMFIQNNGNVGVGVTNPSGAMEIKAPVGTTNLVLSTPTVGHTFSFSHNDTNAIINSSTGGILFQDNGATKVTLDANGNVGIGTTSPQATFEIDNNSGVYGTSLADTIRLVNNTGSANSRATNISSYVPDSLGNSILIASVSALSVVNTAGAFNGAVTFSTANAGGVPTEKVRIDNNGNVGIGTTSPQTSLHIVNTSNTKLTNALTLGNNAGGNGTGTQLLFSLGASGTNVTASIAAVRSNTPGNNATYLSFNTNLGNSAGGATETLRLSEFGGAGFQTNLIGNGALVINQPNASGDIFTASQSGSTKFTISNGGNVGIGTTVPLAPLHVVGSASLSANLIFYGGSTAHTINYDDLGTINFVRSPAGEGGSAATSTLFLGSSGNVGIGITAPQSPLHILNTSNTKLTNSLTLGNGGGGNNTGTQILFNLSSGNSINTASIAAVRTNSSGTNATYFSFNTNLGNSAGGATEVLRLSENGGAGFQTSAIGNGALVVNQPNASGDIFTASQSGSTKFVINNGGNVGIGTNAPGYTLDVQSSISATASAEIYNTNSTANSGGLVVKLGFSGNGTAPTPAGGQGAGNNFIRFLNGSGIAQGSIDSNGSGGVAYQTGGVDFAEYFSKAPGQTFEAGDVISLTGILDNQLATKSTFSYDSHLLGVVSAHPGFIGGIAGDDKVLVGLTGQIPIKVSTENGSIQPGDLLTSSATIPGVAMKATEKGQIVAKALQGYTGNTVGTIQAYVSSSYADPTGQLATLPVNLTPTPPSTNMPILASLSVDGLATVSGDLRVKGNALFEGVVSVIDTITSPNLIISKLADFFGSVIFHSDVSFLGRPTFNQDTAGFAVIRKGATRVAVTFKQQYTQIPLVNINPAVGQDNQATEAAAEQFILAPDMKYTIANLSEKGFSITLNKPAQTEIRFTWSALGVKDATTSTSAPVSIPPSPLPTTILSPTIEFSPSPSQ